MIGDRLDPVQLGAELDEHGHLRIAEIPFGMIIKRLVEKRLAELGLSTTIVEKCALMQPRSSQSSPNSSRPMGSNWEKCVGPSIGAPDSPSEPAVSASWTLRWPS